MENPNFLKEQIITYIGNKRKLLDEIQSIIELLKNKEGLDKINACDLFSGSGIVARMLKQYSKHLYANDLEQYSKVINECYLSNKEDFNEELFSFYKEKIDAYPIVENGFISENYSPKDDSNIQNNERVFYTHENACKIDTIKKAVFDIVPKNYQKYFLAPLIYEASVHVNTSGVFKGFYKSKKTGIGKFGGDGENALQRILGKIDLKKPVFSNFNSKVTVLNKDACEVVKEIKDIDITYIDPPYNQHPYGSNYFMLNFICEENPNGMDLSKVSGIPKNWNHSDFNKKQKSLITFESLIKDISSKYLVISYNNEGFINFTDMVEMLKRNGNLILTKNIDYTTFRGCRNLKNRSKNTVEYIFVLKKY